MRHLLAVVLALGLIVFLVTVAVAEVEITELTRRLHSPIYLDDSSEISISEELNVETSGPYVVEFEHRAFECFARGTHNTSASCDGQHLLLQGSLDAAARRAENEEYICAMSHEISLWFTTPPGQIYPPVGTPYRLVVQNPYGESVSITLFDVEQSGYLWLYLGIEEELDVSGLLQGSGEYFLAISVDVSSRIGTPIEVTAGLEFLFEVLDDTAVSTEDYVWGSMKALFR